MKPISLILSTVIALSIMAGCVEDKDDQSEVYVDITNPTEIEKQSLSVKQNITSDEYIKKHKPSSHSEKEQANYSSDNPRPTSDAVGLSRSKYQVIVENNLFRPLGWRKEVVKKTMPTTETVVETPKERPALTYNLTLTGIAQNGSQRIAIVEDETKKEGYFLHRGEKLKDALVSEIFAEYIVLVVGEAKAQLPLGASIQYNANGEIMLNTITNQKPDFLIPNSEFRIPNSGEDAPKSLIERMKARRRKELGQE